MDLQEKKKYKKSCHLDWSNDFTNEINLFHYLQWLCRDFLKFEIMWYFIIIYYYYGLLFF